ncbi:hypothetical protein [Alteromonas lipolytica]|uniref:Uncharacterized protein n=1 Tax=Alteromonas lipolytica TaxID=1856405 RepID=A0A1E8FJ16_9ALTE|nr:hypothetical protein [Alteromonas lipolytica]OFI35922.1 hypothetical protein BFC17_09535 [Alteromonas lipolytica]GGF72562.1 hypothetical protein GCM10011338_25950 [Alteromonas lipolytica]
MTFALTDYQIAALQEMQIPVWQRQETRLEKSPDSPVVNPEKMHKPVSQDTARSHLQRLKESVSSPAPVTPVTEKAQPVMYTEADYPLFFADLHQALASLNIPVKQVKAGDVIAVTATEITLPVIPAKLTAQHKKQLWQALCNRN